MESTFKKIKRWARVAKPNWWLFFLMLLTSTLPCIVSIFFTLAEAKVVTSITSSNYNLAILWLVFTLIGYLVYFYTWHLNYKYFYKSSKYITMNLSERLYDKLEKVTSQGLSGQSMEKMLNIFSSSINTVQNFADYLSYKLSYLVQSLIIICIVAYYNIYMALILAAIVVLMYFWYVFINNLTQIKTQKIYAARDAVSETLSNYIDGRDYTTEQNLEEQNRQVYLDKVNVTVNNYSKRGLLNCTRKYWTYIVLYTIITALTIWLAVITKNGLVSVTAYLVLAPYFISAIDQAVSGYGLINDLQSCSVNVQRIETILNMADADVIAYSNNTTNKISGNLTFNNINYLDLEGKEAGCGNIFNVNFAIKPRTAVLFRGVKKCGKRAIFYLLRRVITPTTGTITMDGINIFDFDKDTYKHHFSYATSKPYFYSETVLENLRYACSSRKEISRVCKELGIDELIKSLPHGYSTNMGREKESFSSYLLFMIGLARAMLSRAEFLCIYEFPISLTAKEQQGVLDAIKKIKQERAVLIFSASDVAKKVCDDCFIVQAGKINNVGVK